MKRPKKFEADQVWKNEYDYPECVFVVSKVNNLGIYAWKYRNGKKISESLLVHAGTVPDDLNSRWILSNEEFNKNDWRAWQHNQPGECVCGIPRERCDYH